MRKIIAFSAGTGVLLIASILVLLAGLGTPALKQQEVTRVNYQINSNFNQQAYGLWSAGGTPPSPTYFPQIIKSVTGSYTYSFQPQTPVTGTRIHVQIDAIVSSGNLWQKEIALVPGKDYNGSFTLNFPIDLAAFLALNDQINQEIGTKSDTFAVTLVADTRVEADSASGTITDNLDQNCSFILSPLTMVWQPPFQMVQKGYQNGVFYQQQGDFGYSINLKSNTLYASDNITSSPPQAPPLNKLTPATSYNNQNIKRLDITFNCGLTADQPVDKVDYLAGVTAVLSNPDGPQMQFTLLPQQHFNKAINVTMPLDVGLIYDTINKLGDSGIDFNLTLNANVLVTAQSAGETISKAITNSIPVDFNSNSVGWPDKTNTSFSDSITGTNSIPNSARSSTLAAAFALFGFTIVLLLWTGWLVWERKHPGQIVSPEWAAAQDLMAKHKSVITSVDALPAPGAEEKVIPLNSLSGLIKLSDSLLKPVLHQESGGVHLYAVIDNNLRYEYVLNENGRSPAAAPGTSIEGPK